jgi:hypothetical protein
MGELDKVAGGVAAEESRAVRDRGVVVGLMTPLAQAKACLVQVFDFETEMSGAGGIGLTTEEMQLEAIPGREPNQLQMAQCGRGLQLAQSKEITVEGAQGSLVSTGKWRRNVLQAADSHAHVRG